MLWGWYKADEGVTGTTDVTLWEDQSGNGNDLDVTGANKPKLVDSVINSLPVIDSDTDAYIATTNELPILTNGTIYMVALQKAGDISGGMFARSGNNFKIYRNGTSDEVTVQGGSSSGELLTAAITDDTFYSIRVRVTATDFYLSINNGTEQTSARTTTGLANAIVSLFTNAGLIGVKQVAEMLIYTESHDSTTRTEIEEYLQDKYNHY